MRYRMALGAAVHKLDKSLPLEHPDSYNNITPRLARETPNCYFPDQHGNRGNNSAHYHGTGPEIWEQMEGRIDVLVAGAGTGGTIGGVGRFLKEKELKIQVVAVDPVGSLFSPHFHGEGIRRPDSTGWKVWATHSSFPPWSSTSATTCTRSLTARPSTMPGGW